MGLHDVVLMMHSFVRWAVLVGGAVVLGRMIVRRGQPWTETDTKALRAFVGTFDLQLLLGLFMYLGTSAFGARMVRWVFGAAIDMGISYAAIAIKDAGLRFFMIEHPFGMLTAAAILHIGSVRARRLGESAARQKRTALVVGISLAIVLVSVPWPFLKYGRPLLRLGPDDGM
jgi:hypothetical protein